MRLQSILRSRVQRRSSWIVRLPPQLVASLERARLQPCRHMRQESWASAPEGTRTSVQGSSVAKATKVQTNYGTAEAVPLQSETCLYLCPFRQLYPHLAQALETP